MLASETRTFSLWDTNGRRKDVLNALSTYLAILTDLEQTYPNEPWARYPNSVKQYEFYRRAISAAPNVFEDHPVFDSFASLIEQNKKLFETKEADFCTSIGLFPTKNSNPVYKKFDEHIENRARHYTSNLVKMGFATKDRTITPVGREYLSGKTHKDRLESILPIDDINLIILRQLLKMRVFHKEHEGFRDYYSPILYCMQLLLSDEVLEHNKLKDKILSHERIIPETPASFLSEDLISEDKFRQHIQNRKSNTVQADYYTFYVALYHFVHNQCATTYSELLNAYKAVNEKAIKEAFFVVNKLPFKKRGRFYTYSEFVEENGKGEWLKCTTSFNTTYFNQYIASKAQNLIDEYGDTLYRLLTATGVFSFDKALPELLYKSVFREIFTVSPAFSNINGNMSDVEYEEYECNTFCKSQTLTTILGLTQADVDNIVNALQGEYGMDIQNTLHTEKSERLAKHVKQKYPKDKVVELLGYFSDRNNDKKIQDFVNPAADVPTIYEYMIAVAWYYISDMDFSLFQSMNLTLDGNYEPAHHAGGGAGDIVIQYTDKVVMLEATLMNKAAQKRGEWEPVLRHSINLKTDNEDKEVTTFFIADELDMNTINIWRAVASVPLQATNSTAQTDHVYIMPFTNTEVASFLVQNIKSKDILKTVRWSYDGLNYTFNNNWRTDIMQSLIA